MGPGSEPAPDLIRGPGRREEKVDSIKDWNGLGHKPIKGIPFIGDA
jgi:hypothetical protein